MANTQVYVGETGAKELYRKVKAKIEDLGTAVEGELDLKADKTELESAVDTINGSLSDINTELDTKADESDLNDAVTNINTELAGKSDIGHTHVKAEITDFAHNHDDRYYTENEIDGLLGNKEDISNKITAFGDQPTDAQYPSALLVKTEIARLQRIIADLGGFEVVTTLVDGHPNPKIPSHKIIYLYKDPQGPEKDPYTEWIYTVDNEWDVIGTTYVDLSQYYTRDEVDSLLATKVDKVTGKGLSTNDYTDADKDKLDNIESGAEVNLIESVSVAGTALEIKSKSVNVPEAGGTTGAWVKGVVSGEDTARWDSWTDDAYDVPNLQTVINGVTYDYVRIGNQLWLTENLNDTFGLPMISPGTYETNGCAMIYSVHGIQDRSYGLLYNSLALDHVTNKLSDGWHIPSLAEFNTLFEFCGGDEQAINALRSTSGWDRTNGIDSYQFNAKPGGYCDGNDFTYNPGSCRGHGSTAMWWCSYNTYQKTDSIAMTESAITRAQHSFSYFLSLRLVKTLTA